MHPMKNIQQAISDRMMANAREIPESPSLATPTIPAPKAARSAKAPRNLTEAVKHEEIATAEAERAGLTQVLAEARAQADTITAHLAAAEAAWELAEKHTRTDAELLQTLRDEAAPATAHVDEIAQRLAEIEQCLRALRGAQAVEQRQKLAEETWTPFVEARLAPAARHLLTLLTEQDALRERLYDAGAWSNVVRVDDLSITGRYGENILAEHLGQWLAEAERAGYKI